MCQRRVLQTSPCLSFHVYEVEMVPPKVVGGADHGGEPVLHENELFFQLVIISVAEAKWTLEKRDVVSWSRVMSSRKLQRSRFL